MLMQVKPGERASWQHNAKQAWYVGPCLKHYRSFKGVLPSTKGERISDSVRFQHHAIDIPTLTPADRILEAAKQLKDAIEQRPKRPASDEMRAIEMLREVMMGERETPLPLNSVQQRNAAHKKQLQTEEEEMKRGEATKFSPPANYVSDDEDETPTAPPVRRRSQRILSQREDLEEHNPNLHRIYDLAETEQATVPPLTVDQRRLMRGYHAANLNL